MIIAGDQKVVDWVIKRMPGSITSFGDAVSIGVVGKYGKLIAAAAYYNYRGTDIEVAFAADSPKWAVPENIRAMLSYPLIQLGCRRMTTLIDSGNFRAIRLVKRLGFKHEGTVRDAAENGDNIELYGLTRTDFKCGIYYG